MDCKDCLSLLSDYVDGALSGDFLPDIETHLARCPRCSFELSLLRKIDDALRAQRLKRASAGFTERLMERLPAAGRPVRTPALWDRPWLIGWGVGVPMSGVLLIYFRDEVRSFLLQLSSNMAHNIEDVVASALSWLGGLSPPPFPSVSPQIVLTASLTVSAIFMAWSFRLVARALTALRG